MMALVLGFPQMCLKMLGLHGENEKILQNASYKWSYKGNIHTVARPNYKDNLLWSFPSTFAALLNRDIQYLAFLVVKLIL